MSTFYIKLENVDYTKEELEEMLKRVLPIPEPEKHIIVKDFEYKENESN